MSAGIRQIAGPDQVDAALRAGAPLELVLLQREAKDPAVPGVAERARRAGIPVREVGASVLRRHSHVDPPAEIVALIGRNPEASLDEVWSRRGALWLLVDVAYPGNVGMAMRTAEVSGADGLVVDADFDGDQRKSAVRASMRADWYMPVFWERAESILKRSLAGARRVIGVEDVGTRSPWAVDLTGPVLFIVGGEANGIPPNVLERCDAVVRIPMTGFIPAYNLQAAVAIIAAERLRQRELAAP